MTKFEKILGNILASILIAIFAFAFIYNAFCLVFRDGRGASLYGGRGEFYMAE